MAVTNPFSALGPPPSDSDPKVQLDYLRSIIEALHAMQGPQVKPLRKKLNSTIRAADLALKRGQGPERVGRLLRKNIDALQVQTYEVLLTVVHQIRATLKMRPESAPGASPPPRFFEGLDDYASGLRGFIKALRRNDASLRLDADAKMRRGAALMEGRDVS